MRCGEAWLIRSQNRLVVDAFLRNPSRTIQSLKLSVSFYDSDFFNFSFLAFCFDETNFRSYRGSIRKQSLYFWWTKRWDGKVELMQFTGSKIWTIKLSQVCDILFCFDTKTLEWEKPHVSGTCPGARDGHSACIVGSKMYIFGGFEEMVDQFSCDVHCLDLETMTWSFIHTWVFYLQNFPFSYEY